MNKTALDRLGKFSIDNAQNILQLNRLLADANEVTEATCDEYKAYYKIVKFFMEEDYTCYSELAKDWQGMSVSAQGMVEFFHCVRHAMLDDGSMSWVNSPTHGTQLVMADLYDFDDEAEFRKVMLDKYYQVEEVTVHRMYTEAHVDEWLQAREDHAVEQKASWERIAEMRKRVKAKLEKAVKGSKRCIST